MYKLLTYSDLSFRELRKVGLESYQYVIDGKVFTVDAVHNDPKHAWIEYCSDYHYSPRYWHSLRDLRREIKRLQSIWQ